MGGGATAIGIVVFLYPVNTNEIEKATDLLDNII